MYASSPLAGTMNQQQQPYTPASSSQESHGYYMSPAGGSGELGTPVGSAVNSRRTTSSGLMTTGVSTPGRSRLGITSPQVKMKDVVAASKPYLSPLPRSPLSVTQSPSSARDIAALQGHVIPSPNKYASPRQVRVETNALRDKSRDWVRRYRKQTDKNMELVKGVQDALDEWQDLLNKRQDVAADCKASVQTCSQLIERLRHIEQDIVSLDNVDLMTELEEKKDSVDKMITELGDLTRQEIQRGQTGVVDVVCWVLLVLFVIVHLGLFGVTFVGLKEPTSHVSNYVITT